MFYAVFGLSSISFVIHGLILYGWEVQKGRMSLVWIGWMATANLLGAAIYAARVIMFLIEHGSLLDVNTVH
jgi:adiponectin receptor